MKCNNPQCPEILPTHARRKFCRNCRHGMAYHSAKRPAQILNYARALAIRSYRVEHLAERRDDAPVVRTSRKRQ